jgi:hypothetical protein
MSIRGKVGVSKRYDKLVANYLAFIKLTSICIGYVPMSPRPGFAVLAQI